jgi:2-hydroxychromene-2-carboxylate isomerase
MRTLTALRTLQPDALETATKLVFETIWASEEARDGAGNVIMNEEVLARICEKAGVPKDLAKQLVEQDAISPETKDLLKSTVGEAVELGAYGAPFMVVSGLAEGEMVFFGRLADKIARPREFARYSCCTSVML